MPLHLSRLSKRAYRSSTLAALAMAIVLGGGAQAQAQEVSVFNLYFELNATDRDAGLHGLIDGDDWERARIDGPSGLVMRAASDPAVATANFGLTELFFEGNEPTLDERSFADLLALYPAGTYTATLFFINGGDASEETDLIADLPCPPALGEPDVNAKKNEVTLNWTLTPGVFDPDTEICDDGEDVDVVRIEAVVELENEVTGEVRIFKADLVPGATAIEAPEEFIEGAAEAGFDAKAEILVIEATGNRTSVEMEFDLD